jgi:hypothetical protein
MTSSMRFLNRLKPGQSVIAIMFLVCSHDLPFDEDINFDDSTMGFVRSASSWFCLLLGELPRVPLGLDRFNGCCCSSDDSLLRPSPSSLSLLVVRPALAVEASPESRSSRASLACKSER